MVRANFSDKNILIISEDEKSFIFYMEFFLNILKFNKNNNDNLKKNFNKLKAKQQKYFIKITKLTNVKIALICPKNQSPQDIVNLAIKLKDEEKNNKIPKFDKIFCVFDAISPQENLGNNEIYKKIIAPQNLKVLNEKYQNQIEIIDSNPSYEIWLLNHFQNFSDKHYKNTKEVIKEIEKNLQAKNKKFIYEKNDQDWFGNFIKDSHIKKAIKNCQALENHHLNHQTENPNPSSKIYKIIDFIDIIS